MKVFISTVPFGAMNGVPIELLQEGRLDYQINPLGRRLQQGELTQFMKDVDILIAGTETIDREVIDNSPKLKLISRVGIGLDGIDLNYCKKKGISVSYTPDAPAPAVAELTIGLMLSALRSITIADRHLRQGDWNRIFGRRISEICVGIIGAGRIGGRVIRRLGAFGTPKILVNDNLPNPKISPSQKLEWTSKETIFKEADVISLHVPLTPETKDLVSSETLSLMKKDAILINTARGDLVDEQALKSFLDGNPRAIACLDVFRNEPYRGDLLLTQNAILTSHMGSMTLDCRSRMEIEATQEALRFANG